MICFFVGFKTHEYLVKDSTSEVEQEEGVFVFYRSKPVAPYEYIGTYKIGLVWDDKPRLLFNKLIKRFYLITNDLSPIILGKICC